ncbi:hypothetical protein [Rhizobium paknamense]|uniref:Uncharacterized protein n=1 Tax=Rhizobium paknamense TaxID=1206817 RepID=A0ABU0IE99_9HYPH|nr:hypothetical protein [Rhizobium paknamense]MDQ0456491.1 hypothetical protein [Rhizobium paknamense]
MTTRPPPVPNESKSQKGPGDQSHPASAREASSKQGYNPEKQGQQGNSKINTTHQGYQQDR